MVLCYYFLQQARDTCRNLTPLIEAALKRIHSVPRVSLRDTRYNCFSKTDPFLTQGTQLALDKINLVRNEFYKVLLELFAFYKEFVNKDSYGDTIFDIRRFCQVSKKDYKPFYSEFFYANSDKQDKLSNMLFTNFISLQAVNDKQNFECSIIHFQESINIQICKYSYFAQKQSINKLQDGDAIAPHKRPHPFLQDETQAVKTTVEAPHVENTAFTFSELQDAYFLDCQYNDQTPRLFPMEKNKNADDGIEGYRYIVFPCMNELLFKSPLIFNMRNIAQNLENLFQTKYRTDSKIHGGQKSIFKRQKITIPQVSRTMGTYVYITWIYVWCGTLWMQDDREKYFRLVQVLKVIADLKAEYIQRPQLDLFFLLIESSYLYGNMKLTQKISYLYSIQLQ